MPGSWASMQLHTLFRGFSDELQCKIFITTMTKKCLKLAHARALFIASDDIFFLLRNLQPYQSRIYCIIAANNELFRVNWLGECNPSLSTVNYEGAQTPGEKRRLTIKTTMF